MRRLLPLLLPLFLGACAEVDHHLLLRPDGSVAWRVRIQPTVPVAGLDVGRLGEVVAPTGQETIRAWREGHGDDAAFVVHGRWADAAAYTAWRDALGPRLGRVVAEVPAPLLPPTLAPLPEGWTVDPGTRGGRPTIGTGTWRLTVEAPHVHGQGAPAARWTTSAPTAEVLSDGLSADVQIATAPPHPLAWLRDGGPSLLTALTGLGLLVWVVRRTRRQVHAGRHAPGMR